MADVRALLRSERAQRKVSHPQASYTATGTLECTVCHISLTSDIVVWNKHLKSTQHAMRAERLRLSTFKPPQPTAPRAISNGTKKRKASNDDDDARKRSRPVVDLPGSHLDDSIEANNDNEEFTAGVAQEIDRVADESALVNASSPHRARLPSHPITAHVAPIDEDEWAAFERDVATPPPEVQPSISTNIAALNASATISAAPMTAAEIAAQARQQANTQSKERREAEVEGEKEDAARALEEEFDEMEGLEERVRRLREMREALRLRNLGSGGDETQNDALNGDPGGRDLREDELESEDDDVDDGWGVWGT